MNIKENKNIYQETLGEAFAEFLDLFLLSNAERHKRAVALKNDTDRMNEFEVEGEHYSFSNAHSVCLMRALSIAQVLNLKFFDAFSIETGYDSAKGIPLTAEEIYELLCNPLADILFHSNRFPEWCFEILTSAEELCDVFAMEALVEKMSDGSYVLTADAEEYMQLRRTLNGCLKAKNLFHEYSEKRIYEELRDGDYVEKRKLLIDPQNQVISGKPFELTASQQKLIEHYPKLTKLAYQRTVSSLYECKYCKAAIAADENGKCRCLCRKSVMTANGLNKLCDASEKWLGMNPVAQQYFYIPGCLEREIAGELERLISMGIVEHYEWWPSDRKGNPDAWDFAVALTNGLRFHLDAKRFTHPYPPAILRDKAIYVSGVRMVYIVPNTWKKKDLILVNKDPEFKKRADCLKLSEVIRYFEKKGKRKGKEAMKREVNERTSLHEKTDH